MVIRYFAWLRYRTGVDREEIHLPDGITTVAELMVHLGERHPRFGEALTRPGVVRCAIDHEHVATDAQIGDAREIAFFPPITGG